jgi:hypothetical protein
MFTVIAARQGCLKNTFWNSILPDLPDSGQIILVSSFVKEEITIGNNSLFPFWLRNSNFKSKSYN